MTDSVETASSLEQPKSAQSEAANAAAQGWSPTRSLLAILAGLVMNGFLQVLLALMVARLFHLEVEPEAGAAHVALPRAALTYLGLGVFMNTAISGMTTARIAQLAPLRHGIVLGAIFGFLVSAQLDRLRGYPGAFVVVMVLAPVFGSTLGGWWVSRSARRRVSA